MIVIDDSNMRLLKMKERLLEISNGMDKVSLEDFKKLAIAIENQVYNKLLEKISKSNAHSYSLEEQLTFLNEIEKDYNDLFELRCSFELINNKYSMEPLELSDLSNILIENIRNRKNLVEGYLVNNKNIVDTKKELEKLNFQLIQEEKKKDEIGRKLKQLESELKNNVLNAEGRIYSDIGSLKYTSIVQEFRDNSFELKELLENKEKIDEEFNIINEREVASSEKLLAAKICYQNMPSAENLAVYRDIDIDAAKIRYQLVLLRIAALVAEEAETYTQAVEKRMEIISLNSVRVNCLRKLGVNLSIDSFARIRIKEQLDIIESLGDNSKTIAIIRRNIDNYNTLIEERMRQNNEYMLIINDKLDFIKDDTSFINIAEDNVELPSEVIRLEDYNYDNKVIKVEDVTDEFMLNRVAQKTNGVINKVNEVYNGVPIEASAEVTNPELLVVPLEEHPDEMLDQFPDINEEMEKTEENENNIFTINDTNNKDEYLPDDAFANVAVSLDDNSGDIFTTFDVNNETTDLSDDVFANVAVSLDNDGDDIFNTLDSNAGTTDLSDDVFIDNSEAKPNEVIFSDTVPFESAPLFSDRYDDGVFVSEKPIASKQLVALPELNKEVAVASPQPTNNETNEVFWPTQEQMTSPVPETPVSNVLSFDEQVNALIGNEPKVKKKVA